MPDSKRLLVLAGEAVAELAELPREVRTELETAEEVFVVTPTLASGIEWLMSDTDRPRHAADERLDTILGQLERSGAPVSGGAVGDLRGSAPASRRARRCAARGQSGQAEIRARNPRPQSSACQRIASHTGLPLTVFAIDAQGRVRTV